MPDYERRDWFMVWFIAFIFAPAMFATWTLSAGVARRDACTHGLNICERMCKTTTTGDSEAACLSVCVGANYECLEGEGN